MTNYWPEGWLVNTAQNHSFCQNISGLREALHSQTILEARACVCTPEHDLVVDFGFCKGKIPRCEGAVGISDGTTRDIALLSRVNKPVCFVVQSIEQNPDGSFTPILSRRLAQQRCLEESIRHLHAGDIIPARVTHLEAFGCFVDIGCDRHTCENCAGNVPHLPPVRPLPHRTGHLCCRHRCGPEPAGILKP